MADRADSNRELSHKRTITLEGYARDDGHYDIEAELIDVKNHDFPSRAHGQIKKNQPLHHMKVRVTVSEEMTILDASATTLAGPYNECPHGAENFQNLIGKSIQPGWKKIVAKAIGGRDGCTHITELMGPVATVAFQTIYGERAKRRRQEMQSDQEQAPMAAMIGMMNSCYALAEGSEAANWYWDIPQTDRRPKKES